MRKSRSITLTVLSGLMLTACCITSYGCGGRTHPPPDHTWYDASGNRVPEKFKTDASGQLLRDEEGRTIPEPGVPYDNYGRQWVYQNDAWVPLPPPYTRSSSWIWSSGSGYRTTGGSSYHPAVGGAVSPSRSVSPSGSAPSGSVSRGGFGTTGAGISSGT